MARRSKLRMEWKAGDRRVVTVVLVAGGGWKIADLRYESGETSRDLLVAKE